MIFDNWQDLHFGNSNSDELLSVLPNHPVRPDGSNIDSPTSLATTADDSPIIIIGMSAGASSGTTGGGFGSGSGSGRNLEPRQHSDDGTPDSTDPVAKETPCVETTFATSGATTASANDSALAAANAIAALNDETFEYSSIVYYSNGNMGFTSPWTNNLTDEVNWVGGLGSVPSGAVIVGIVHNHPDDPVMNDTIPSGGGQDGQDWQSYSQLVNFNSDSNPQNLPNGITVDPNMLLYIYSNQDNQTHVYDNTDKNQTSTSCSL